MVTSSGSSARSSTCAPGRGSPSKVRAPSGSTRTPLNRLMFGATSRRAEPVLGQGQGEVVAPVGRRAVGGAVAVAGLVGGRGVGGAAEGVVAAGGVLDDRRQHPTHVREQQRARRRGRPATAPSPCRPRSAARPGGRAGAAARRRRRRRATSVSRSRAPAGQPAPPCSRRRRRPRPTGRRPGSTPAGRSVAADGGSVGMASTTVPAMARAWSRAPWVVAVRGRSRDISTQYRNQIRPGQGTKPDVHTGGQPRRRSRASVMRPIVVMACTPSHGSGSGSHRRDRWSTHGRRVRSVSCPTHEVGDAPPGGVGGGDALAGVAAAPGEAGVAVEADAGEQVAGDAEHSAPVVGVRCPAAPGTSARGPCAGGPRSGVVRRRRRHLVAQPVRRTETAPDDAAVGGALPRRAARPRRPARGPAGPGAPSRRAGVTLAPRMPGTCTIAAACSASSSGHESPSPFFTWCSWYSRTCELALVGGEVDGAALVPAAVDAGLGHHGA